MITKYTAENVRKQRFVVGKFHQWEIMDNKYIKTQINKYHRMLEDMKAGNINLFEGLITEILIKKYSTHEETTKNN